MNIEQQQQYWSSNKKIKLKKKKIRKICEKIHTLTIILMHTTTFTHTYTLTHMHRACKKDCKYNDTIKATNITQVAAALDECENFYSRQTGETC